MIALFVLLLVVVAVLIGAIRIIMGWILPKASIANFDRRFRATLKLIFQIYVVAAGLLIVYVGWLAFHPT